MQWRYILYNGSRKWNCPQCGHQTYVRYIDTFKHHTLMTFKYGRCDRENSCGYWLKPKNTITTDDYQTGINQTIVQQIKQSKKRKSIVRQKIHIPLDFYEDHTDPITKDNCYLAKTLDSSVVFKECQARTIKGLPETVCWPWINAEGHIRAIQIHKYRENTYNAYDKKKWFHKFFNLQESYYKQTKKIDCFFNEHLLTTYPQRKVILVEGAKTALTAMKLLKYPDTVIIASFSQSYLKMEHMKKLAEREVHVIPDIHSFQQWKDVCQQSSEIYPNMKIFIYDDLEKIATPEQMSKGWDIGDFLVHGYQDFQLKQ